MSLDLRFRPWRTARPGHRHRSIWVDQALALETSGSSRTLEDEQHFDVCIVGGGFTGLWTAHRLRDLDPAMRISVVDADDCGTGASGRNSGAMSHWWSKLQTLLRLLGPEDAKRVLRASITVLEEIHAFLREHGIECELRRVPSVWSATAPAQVGAWNGVLRAAETLGLAPPYGPLAPEELRTMFGKGPYPAGALQSGARPCPRQRVIGLMFFLPASPTEPGA